MAHNPFVKIDANGRWTFGEAPDPITEGDPTGEPANDGERGRGAHRVSAVLLVVDMQRASAGNAPEAKAVGRLIAHWRERGLAVVHLRHDSMDPEAPDAVGGPGHDFVDAARPLDTEIVVEHRTGNTFIGTDLMQVLEDTGSHELVVCGAVLEGAVESTVRMAHALGFLCLVPEDAVVARDVLDRAGRRWSAKDVKALTLGVLHGSFASVVAVEALVMGEGAVAN